MSLRSRLTGVYAIMLVDESIASIASLQLSGVNVLMTMCDMLFLLVVC